MLDQRVAEAVFAPPTFLSEKTVVKPTSTHSGLGVFRTSGLLPDGAYSNDGDILFKHEMKSEPERLRERIRELEVSEQMLSTGLETLQQAATQLITAHGTQVL